MERNCDYCGTTYSRPPSLIGSYCSKKCGYAARRKDRTRHRRMRYLPGHPLAGKTGLVAEARAVVYERLGPGKHPCHWCGERVEWMRGARGNVAGSLVVDHLDADPLNDQPDNLVQSCARCNSARGQAHRAVTEDELYITDSNGWRHRAVERTCEKCDKPFLIAKANLQPGKGRFCSRSCARSLPRTR